jgi:hypothetical protein
LAGNYTPCVLLGGLVMEYAWRRTRLKYLFAKTHTERSLQREKQRAREETSKHDITFN